MPDYSDLAYAMGGYGKRRSRFDDRRKIGQQLMLQGSDTSPIQSPWQGVGRLAQALAGGLDLYTADRDEEKADKTRSDALAKAMAEPDPTKKIGLISAIDPDMGMKFGGQLAVEQAKQQQASAALKSGAANFGSAYGAPQGPQQATGQPSPLQPGTNASAIAGIESNGQPNGGYGAVGPPANAQGNRAYGRYQVLDSNIGPWTQQILGKAMSPQEFLANKEAQDKVFETKFTEYVQKYGSPQAASRAWFAGEGGMNNPNAKDVNGVSVAQYEGKFNGALGGQPQPGQPAPGVPGAIAQSPLPPPGQPPQVAQGGGDGTPPQPNPAGIQGPSVIAPPAVPDVPRPQPSQQQIQQFQQRIASGEFGVGPEAVSKARAALDADIDRQWAVDRERAKMGYEQKQGDHREARKNQGELDRAAPMELIKQRTKNYEENIRPRAESAVSEIGSIHQMRQLLDAGVITGTGAEARMAMQKAAQSLGIEWGTDQVANTVALQSAVGQRVLALVKNLGAGAGISNADREYAAKIAGGEISMTEPSMRRVMDIGERAARATLKNHDGEVSRIRKLNGMKDIPSDYFEVPKAPSYDEWKAANPTPGATPPPGTPAPGVPGQTAAPPVQSNGFAPHPNPNAPTNMQPAPAAVPDAAAGYLKANPGLAAEFDKKYGPGSAARVLGR